MSMWHGANPRRAAASALAAVTLSVALVACGSGGEEPPQREAGDSAAADTGKDRAPTDSGTTLPDTSKILATLKGDQGIEMVIYEAKRDEGGFLTVNGEFRNTGGSAYVTPVQWSGQEAAIAGAGPSLGGMTLVDSKEKKRYYVLRDTDNRPLTTSQYAASIEAGKSLSFFAQFPAPPQSTTKVDLQFPGFPNAPIEIS
ncbi:hypothetical protein [Streptomyces sp. AK02-01A]|uniref:hypothetical protein n=1 Tax=Streptomyces sp. AK02-01A TaxID=3028648 RepID=UPI0029B4357B|nr:hypothetical protein [Streptomyces sp. AK02-01A]MDX3851668.1 hypothetical protein [Streptomyces sp. AK02-01A]